MSKKPDLKLLRPNFKIANTSQLQEQEPTQSMVQADHQQKSQEPPAYARPFIRPPSSRKEDVRQSQQFQESMGESKLEEQKMSNQRRTPVNGFRKFNLQTQQQPQLQMQEDNSQYQGKVINMRANKEKIQQKVNEINQQELRQKLQVKVEQRPMNQPETNIFKPQDSADTLGADLFKKNRPIRPLKQQEATQKDTIKVAELLENKIQFNQTNDIEDQQQQINEQKKTARVRVKQQSQDQDQQPILQEEVKQPTQSIDQNQKKKKQTKTIQQPNVHIDEQEQITQPEKQKLNKQEKQPEKVQPQQSQLDNYKERTMKFNTQPQSIQQSKKDNQKQRVQDLNQLITLEIDDYSNQLVIQPRTEYETYLNLIKCNALRNSCDQAFDDKLSKETQTDEFTTNDFGNQCPEDYTRTFLQNTRKQQTARLGEFIESVFEIIEEILELDTSNQNKENIKNDIFIFPKEIQSCFNCQSLNLFTHQQFNNKLTLFQAFNIESKQFAYLNGSIIVQYPKNILYYIPTQITSIACNKQFLICGNINGQIAGWSMNELDTINNNNKFSQKLKEQLKENCIIKFIGFSTEWNLQIIDQFSDYTQLAQIHSIKFNEYVTLSHEFVSMDIFGNIQIWQINDQKLDEQEKFYVELGIKTKYKLTLQTQILKPNFKLYNNLSLNLDNILICGPTKVVNVNIQRSYCDDSYIQPVIISNIYHNFFCIGYIDGHIALFHKDFTRSIWQIRCCNTKIIWIHIQGDGQIIVISKEKNLYYFDLLSNQQDPFTHTTLNEHSIYFFAQNNGLAIIIDDKQKLQIINETLSERREKCEVLDGVFQEYCGQ